MLLTLSGRSFIKIQYSSFLLFPVAYPFRIAIQCAKAASGLERILCGVLVKRTPGKHGQEHWPPNNVENGNVGKQPVVWKEYCVEYWLKELQESMDRSIGHQIMLKTAMWESSQWFGKNIVWSTG